LTPIESPRIPGADHIDDQLFAAVQVLVLCAA